MSIEGSQGALAVAYSEFSVKWEGSAAYWQDAKREEFDSLYVANLDGRVRAATAAMTDLATLVRQIRRECE